MDCIEEMQKNLSRMTRLLMKFESGIKEDNPLNRSLERRQKSKKNRERQLSKFKKLLNRVERIFAFNEDKAILREDLIDVLALEDFTDRRFIRISLDQLIKEGILYEPRRDYLKIVKRHEDHEHEILDVKDFKLSPDCAEESNKDLDN